MPRHRESGGNVRNMRFAGRGQGCQTMVTAGTDDVTEGTRLKLPGAGASTTCEIKKHFLEAK